MAIRIIFLLSLLTLASCSENSSINVGNDIVLKAKNFDQIPPVISFQSIPASINGAENYTLNFTVEDDQAGSGIANAKLYYSPDGVKSNYKLISDVKGKSSLKFCTPNKSHPLPTFKIIAQDRNGNISEKSLGDTGPNYSITLMTEPPKPTLASSEGATTNNTTTDILINSCTKTYCDADAAKYESPTNDLFIALKGTAPTAGDAAWVSCQDVLNDGITTSNFPSDGDSTFNVWVKSEDTDEDSTPIVAISSTSEDITVTYDSTPPDPTSTVIEGTSLTAKSLGKYKLVDCADTAHVLINKDTSSPPLETAPTWQSCSDTSYSMLFTDFTPGDNSLVFWFKDSVGNVSSTFVPYTTTYTPPTISIVDGPTITTPDASMTMQFCEEASITEVLFNLTASVPTASDSGWQTCSKAVGAMTYGKLSPGPSTIRAFFKYADNSVAPNHVDVPVFYSPKLAWIESPSVNRPQASFTIFSCEGINAVLFNKTTIPAAGDAGWQPCSLATASLSYTNLSVGDQTLNVWFKDALNNVYGDNTTINVNYTPPTTTVKDDPTVTTSTAFLTASTCDGISEVLTTVDDATTPTAATPGWTACSTANYALQSPSLGAEGAHTLRTWFKYSDGFIPSLSSDHVINYDAPDLTPPPLTTGEGADSNIVSSLANGDGSGPPELVLAADSRGDFTINSCDPIAADSEDDIAQVIVTTTNTIPNTDDLDWQACSTSAGAIQSPSLPDGNNNVYIWYKDINDNITTTAQVHNFNVNTATDTTPPPRPLVTVENAPTLTSAPAELTVTDCTDIDQVFVNLDGDAMPAEGAAGWSNCSTATGAIKYPISIAGSYTVQAWFKDAAGNINPLPRNASFIFAPVPSTLPSPIATWSLDSNHFFNGLLVDIRGNNNLRTSNFNNLSFSIAKVKEGLDFTAPNTYAVIETNDGLKPTTSVSLGLWVYLNSGDATSQTIVGNASSGTGYSLKIESSELRFSVNGNHAALPTSSYTTGWHYVTGVSDGSTIKLFLNGELRNTYTFGSPQNITYGCAKIFAIGGAVNGCDSNIDASSFFTGKMDEINLWDQALTDENVYDLFVDNSNNFKVNHGSTVPADIASASFHGAFEQNALLNVSTCGDAEFIYIDETTHPPLADDPSWQPCNAVLGGHAYSTGSAGPHELKVWAKDEYDNISTGYQKVDTVITSTADIPNPVLYWNFDSSHISGTDIDSLYSLHQLKNSGALTGTPSIQNEGVLLNKTETDFVEAQHASASMLTSNFTISIWANLTNNDGRNQTLMGNRVGNDGYSLEIENASGMLKFIVGTGSSTREIGVLTTSYTTGYHNIAATYDGQVAQLYVDGISVASNDFGSVQDVTYSCLPSFMIGAGATCNQGGAAGSHFDNYLDEAIVFDTALGSTQVSNMFNGSDSIPPEPVAVTPKNNTYTINIPITKLNVSDCSDISKVYVALDSIAPTADAASWQACSETGNNIESALLADGANDVKVWFQDAAGNVSTSSTDLTITYNYDFTIPSPDSYWPLDDVNIDGATAYDVTSTNNATVYNATKRLTGVSKEALDFNGTNAYAKANYNASLQPTDKVTLSAWINVPSWPSSNEYIAGNLNGGGYALLLGNNTIEWHVKANGVIQTVSVSTAGYPAGSNYMITGVYDDGVLRLFVDDTEVQQLDLGSDYLIEYDNTNAFVIGSQSGTATSDIANTGFITGMIDEVSFWQNALTDTVIDAMLIRGQNEDKVFYDVTPPEIPQSVDIIYYNSLVSRANVTVTDCTGIDSMIITASTFPPDKNDEDWQTCNTLTGGTLSKELKPEDSFGKLWLRDQYGNISKTFEYVPLTTLYDKPIARPIAHWTFDNAHYNGTTRIFLDRISRSELLAEKVDLIDADPGPGTVYNVPYNGTATTTATNLLGVLNESIQHTYLDFTRCDDCEITKPKETLSISAWVKIPAGHSGEKQMIATTLFGGKGYGLRFKNDGPLEPRVVFELHTENGDTLEPYLETSNLSTAWHLVTGTYDGQVASLYIDGIFIKSFSAPAPSPISYTDGVKFAVGSGATTTILPEDWELNDSMLFETYYDGEIDEVLIWDKPLTGEMVSSLYHNGADILYESDTTEPTPPSMTQENQRASMYDDRVYATVSSCSDISGVLINEGTQPDKQDARWEICRTRPGSFKYNLATTGGHTVTYWFKDLAGNVTSASSDLVVDYQTAPLPISNAYWPLNEESFVDNFALDAVSISNEHDLYAHDFDNAANPSATFTAGQHQDAMLLDESYLVAPETSLLEPVNEMTLSGWFYLTNGDNTYRILIDKALNEGSSANAQGYKIYTTDTGNLCYKLGLKLNEEQLICSSLAATATGWHLVTATFSNDVMKLYLDATEVATRSFTEEDFIKRTNTNLIFGAQSSGTAKPTDFFSEKVDEISIWGQALTPTEITDVYNKGLSSQMLFDLRITPDDVNNAYVNHYANFESRVRISMLDCTNMPYIYVGPNSLGTPDPKSDDWHKCSTSPGAIFSSKLAPGTQYVRVWSKNTYGDISSNYATLEIPIISETSDIILPKFYWDFNAEHRSSGSIEEVMLHELLTFSDASLTQQFFAIDEGVKSNSSSNTYFGATIYNDNGHAETISFWTELDPTETDEETYYSQNITRIYQSSNWLHFEVYRPTTGVIDADIVDTTEVVSVDLNKIPAGKHYVSAVYDGKVMQLYIDAVLWAEEDIAMDNFQSDSFLRLYNGPTRIYFFSDNAGTPYTDNTFDEFMIFQEALTQTQIEAHYNRVAKAIYAGDTTPPATTPTISVSQSTFGGGKWPTNDKSTFLKVDDCADISGVFISVGDASQPNKNAIGWQKCVIEDGAIKIPDLTVGDNSIYVWYKDSAGNVTAVSDDIVIDYTIDPIPTPTNYWSFDSNTIFNNVAFETVNQRNAELISYTSTAGKVNEAFQGNLFRKLALVKPDNSYKPTEEMSVSFWTDKEQPCPIVDNEAGIISTMNNDNTGYQVTRIRHSGSTGCNPDYNTLRFDVSLNSVKYTSYIPFTYLASGLNHIVISFDGRKVTWFVNNNEVHIDDFGTEQSITYTNANTPLLIGARLATDTNVADSTSFFGGIIDELAIFDKALVPTHVNDLYTKGNSNQRVYDANRPVITPLNTVGTIHEASAGFTYGDRIRATISDCTNMDLVLINDSVTAPSDSDENWQVCNTFDGAILSSPLTTGSVLTPRLWAKSFEGEVSAASGTLNAQTITVPSDSISLDRPKVLWTFDETATGHTDATNFYDALYYHPTGVKGSQPSGFEPTATSNVDPNDAILNEGFSFDGTDDYLFHEITGNNSFTSDFSISLWAYLEKGDERSSTLLSNMQRGSNDDGGIRIHVENNKLKVSIAQNDLNSYAYENKYLEVEYSNLNYVSGFHNIVATFDGEVLKLFLDGLLVAEKTYLFYSADRVFAWMELDTPWYIGAELAAGNMPLANSYFDSIIDDVTMWNTSLPVDQITQLFNYGAQFIPSNTSDGIAPTDPGILIDGNKTVGNLPYVGFTMPSCTGANGQNINGVYFSVQKLNPDDPVPTAPSLADPKWQFCTTDSGNLLTEMLSEGDSRVYIYFKDDQGDISTGSTIDVTYVAPEMINPHAYYDFESVNYDGRDNKSGINGLHTRSTDTNSSGVSSTALSGGRSFITFSPYVEMNSTHAHDLGLKTDFTISLWYMPTDEIDSTGRFLSIPNQIDILKNGNDTLNFTVRTKTRFYGHVTKSRVVPNEWNHILLTRSGSAVSLYLNGEKESTLNVAGEELAEQTANWILGEENARIDELAFYRSGLSKEQSLYLYYLGKNGISVPAVESQLVTAPTPDNYYDFNDANLAATILNDQGSSPINLTLANAVTTGSVDSIQGESFHITRFEDSLESGDNNSVGSPQYLQGAAPVSLGSEFTISTWAKFSKSTAHGVERHTIISQWGDTDADQSFRLYLNRVNLNSDKNFLVFEMRVPPFNTLHKVVANLDQIPMGDTNWRHVTVKRVSKKLIIYIDGYQSGFTLINTAQPVIAATQNLRVGDTNMSGIDENRFEGQIDELAIWKDLALDFKKIHELNLRGLANGKIANNPQVTIAGVGTDVTTEKANLTINDCNSNSHVMILDSSSPVPLAGDSGWQECSTDIGAILSNLLNFNTTNNLTAYFKNGGVVDSYTYDFDVVHNQTDTTPPTSPTVTLESGTSVTSATAIFTVNSCSDIGGVYIGPTSTTPTSTQSGWQNCTTVNSATKYTELVHGTNQLSFWFKDSANNISPVTRDFTITFTEPVIPVPDLYIPADKFYSGAAGAYDMAYDNFFTSNDVTKTLINSDSKINQSFNFVDTAYIERDTGSLALGASYTFASWINISTPSVRAVIASKWDETDTNNEYSVEIDSEGRLCFALQTVASTGNSDWGTSSYKRECSTAKINFSSWNHVAVVRNTTNVTLYINGEGQTITTFDSSNFISSAAQLRIGAQDRGGITNFTQGSFDELGIWTSAFTQDQIEAIYSRGQNKMPLASILQAQNTPLPYSYWTMDNSEYSGTTLSDLMGNLNLENIQSASLTYASDYAFGKVNEAFEFFNEEKLEGSASSINLATNFTISTLFSITEDTDDNASIINKSDGAANNEFEIYTHDNEIHVGFETTSASYAYTLPTPLVYDQWYSLIVMRNGTELKVFVNGALELFVTIDADPILDSTVPVRLGADSTGTINYLSGSIDETVIWKKSIDASQAQFIFENQNANILLPTSITVSVAHPSNTVYSNTADLTVSDCANFTHVLVQNDGDPAPLSGDGRWVACNEAIAGIASSTLISGFNTLDIWFKTATVVEASETTEVTIEYVP